MANVIEVDTLKKAYGTVEAVRGISFEVREGEVFGFVGPNGAGKTTTIKMLSTLLDPSSGRATVAGFDVVKRRAEVRDSIGVVFQDTTLDDQLTAMENLTFHGLLYGLSSRQVKERSKPLMELAGLGERMHSLVKTYSGGMKRRLELVRGLLHTPRVLFLDEPTVGLDPQSRAQMWGIITQLAKDRSVAVFMTTHYMDEAEYTERMAIMDHGLIQALDTPEALKRQIGQDIVIVESASPPTSPGLLEKAGADVRGEAPRFEIRLSEADAKLPQLMAAFGAGVTRVEVKHPSLDTVFLELTGREIREEEPEPMAHRWMMRGRRA